MRADLGRSALATFARNWAPWAIAWIVIALAGAVWIARSGLGVQREAFEANARIAHRLLSLRAVEHEAILATLALLDANAAHDAASRLPSIYPRIHGVIRREAGAAWPAVSDVVDLAAAEEASRREARAYGLVSELAHGRLWLVLAARPASYALELDLTTMVPTPEWPLEPTAPERVVLAHAGHAWVIQPGKSAPGGWKFTFEKRLAVVSQPFDLLATRRVGWEELPWWQMLLWSACVGAALAAVAVIRAQRTARRRAEALVRVGQVARLNTLGELAAGVAHELNQPLTAILANTRAADRLLRDEPADLASVRSAMTQAGEQARRAADVVKRMRRAVERPAAGQAPVPVDMAAVVRSVLHLIDPECRRRGVRPRLSVSGTVCVAVDPVAVEQIVHNLVVNALQALEGVAANERQLWLEIDSDGEHGRLHVADSGPGVPEADRARLFEPFFTTRDDGLGLGLSLCENLAESFGGRLQLGASPARGAVFVLSLPLYAS